MLGHRANFNIFYSYLRQLHTTSFPTLKFSDSDLWRAKQSHDISVVMNVLLLSLQWQLTHQMMTNQLATLVTTHSFKTDPPFHSQILQMQCLAVPYMSQNFFSEHMKAKSTIHYSAVMTEKLHCTDSWHRELKYVACKTIIVSFG
jgi:hypothetical protein